MLLLCFFFYKVRILSTLSSSFGIESAFCHKIVVTTRRQQQRGRYEIWGLQGK